MNDSFIQEIDELFKGKPFLTVDDVTQILGCAKTVIYNWTKRPDAKRRPPRIFVGKELRFPKREFLRWLQEEQSSSSSTFSENAEVA